MSEGQGPETEVGGGVGDAVEAELDGVNDPGMIVSGPGYIAIVLVSKLTGESSLRKTRTLRALHRRHRVQCLG